MNLLNLVLNSISLILSIVSDIISIQSKKEVEKITRNFETEVTCISTETKFIEKKINNRKNYWHIFKKHLKNTLNCAIINKSQDKIEA